MNKYVSFQLVNFNHNNKARAVTKLRTRFDFLQTCSCFSLRVVFVHALSDLTDISDCFIRQIASYLPLKNESVSKTHLRSENNKIKTVSEKSRR